MAYKMTGVSIGGTPFRITREWFREMNAAVAQVHSLPFPPVAYRVSRSKKYAGLFDFGVTEPDKLLISVNGLTPHLTFAQMGHRVEKRVLPELAALFDKSNHDWTMLRWFQSVRRSEGVQRMIQLRRGDGGDKDTRIDYYMEPSGLWTRTYAQYVAVNSGHPAMMEELRSLQSLHATSPDILVPQWEDEDFGAILEKVGDLIRAKGW